MKDSTLQHVFHVHSAITDIMARAVIRYRQLDPENCVFIISRNYVSSFPSQVRIPFPHLPVDYFDLKVNFWNNWQRIKELDEWVHTLVKGQSFEFYSLQARPYLHGLMVSHKNCKAYHFIEEGTSAYLQPSQWSSGKKSNLLKQWIYQLNYGNRIPVVRNFYDFKHPKYGHSYGCHPKAFAGVPGAITIPLLLPPNPDYARYQDVLVLSPHNEFGQFPLEVHLSAVERGLHWMIEKQLKQLWFKFHPGQDTSSREAFKNLFSKFQNRIAIQEITTSVVLEEIAVTTDVNFYTMTSSVAIYAHIAGKKVYGLNRFVYEAYPPYKILYEQCPEVLKQSIENL